MAAPTYVDGNTQTGGGGQTSATFDWAGITGVANDDVGVVAIYKESTAAFTATPTGWTQLGPWDQSTGGFKYRADLWWKRRAAGDTGNATWSWSGPTWRSLRGTVYRGLITSETPVIGASSDMETAQNTSPSHPGITVARTDSGVLAVVFSFTENTVSTPPSGLTEQEAGNHETHHLVDLSTTTGATGAIATTLSDPEYSGTVVVELVTAAAGGAAFLAAQNRPILQAVRRASTF